MAKTNVKWELFCDPVMADFWAVRPVGDKDFNSPRLFHFYKKEDAEAFFNLIKNCHCAIPSA